MRAKLINLNKSLILIGLFVFFAVNANPGWVKYPDSLFYLEIAKSWSKLQFVLDDGTGAFVRPLAYLIYGFGYKLAGFSGIHLLGMFLVFLTIYYSTKKISNLYFFIILIAIISSKSFTTYSNSILLQILGFSIVLYALIRSYRFAPFDIKALILNLLLIAGIFIHGGIIFLWLSFLLLLPIVGFSRFGDNSLKKIVSLIFKSGGYFLFLILILAIMELLFHERVIKSFIHESGFLNSPEGYYFGKFYVVYFNMVMRDLGVIGIFVTGLSVLSFLLIPLQIFKGNRIEQYSLWLFLYLLVFEMLTSLKIMQRDPTAGEYYRTYFMSYPLLALSSYVTYSSLINQIKSKTRIPKVSKYLHVLVVFIGIYFITQNIRDLRHRFDLSPYAKIKEVLLNPGLVDRSEDILLVPSNIYSHRKFFKGSDFLGSRAIYFSDLCPKENFIDIIKSKDYIYVVTEKSLLDKRENNKLIKLGAECSPDRNYDDILASNGFLLVSDSTAGRLYRRIK
jgi:hypothetical protein